MTPLDKLSIPSQGIHKNLCWAAVTVGICDFLDSTQLTLEDVTSKCLSLCYGDLSSSYCDTPYELEDALRSYQHPARVPGRTLSFDEISNEITNRQKPIGIMITFPDQVNHYCVIKGCITVDGQQEVIVLDPLQTDPTDISIPLASLLSGAVLGAPWKDSCLIR